MISIRNLTHIYPGTRKQPDRTALDGLSVEVPAGAFCILAGPNGSGKSTLFRILCGLALPSAGEVQVAGHDLVTDPAAVRGVLGVVFQSPAVDKHLTVAENLGLQADLYGLKGAAKTERMAEALGWTELKERTGQKVETLSGGLARQLELAKALMTRPQVLLLDEPTTGLDPVSRRKFLDALKAVQKQRPMTVLMTTHIFDEAEDADQVVILKSGLLLANDSPTALRATLGREMVVAVAHDAPALEARLVSELGLVVRRHGDELRLEETENGESLPLLQTLLDRYRPDLTSISIKRPALEDVFIHLTSQAEARQLEQTGS